MLMYDYHDDPEIEDVPPENGFEDVEIEDSETTAKDKVKDLRQKLKESEAKRAAVLEDLQRAKAEFLNSRRLQEEDRSRDKNRQINDFIERLTPLSDSFAMAMSDKAAWEAIDKNWRIGVESIYAQLQNILKDYSVKTIDDVGVEFDPNKHEAIATVSVTDKDQDHKVISVVQIGYERMVDGKAVLIRPARVTVGELKTD